jgi:fused signal recognition particle receptor
MFGFFRRKPAAPVPSAAPVEPAVVADVSTAPVAQPDAQPISVEGSVIEPVQNTSDTPERASWFKRLKGGLAKTGGNISSLFSRVKVDEALYEELETALLTSDAGVEATEFVLTQLRERVRRDRLTEASQVKDCLRQLLFDILQPLERDLDIDRPAPIVVMISGVNGAGKTTTIGKLTHHLQAEKKSVLLAAGDTFRAAAREQLAAWGQRNNVTVISQDGGDPAAVAFDTVNAARARGTHVAIIDTAGRLPTQTHLMDELKKIRRVIAKAMPDAPHESLLVLDGNTGQNMIAQAKAFDAAVELTGLVVTKLDGTAKGGAVIALARLFKDKVIPIYFIGVGEGLDDLQSFRAREFVNALID